jgi:hypothetical protein
MFSHTSLLPVQYYFTSLLPAQCSFTMEVVSVLDASNPRWQYDVSHLPSLMNGTAFILSQRLLPPSNTYTFLPCVIFIFLLSSFVPIAMLKSPGVSHFQAVRAKWETQTQKRDDSPSRQRLVSRTTSTANINTATRQKSSTFERLTASTNKPNRLASLTMFNKSLTSLRPKGFSRHRQPSGNNEASQSTMTLVGTNRDSFNPMAPPSSPFTDMHVSISQPNSKPAPSLVRSSTTSYLPVPTKVSKTLFHLTRDIKLMTCSLQQHHQINSPL